jgi:hypothetical protein
MQQQYFGHGDDSLLRHIMRYSTPIHPSIALPPPLRQVLCARFPLPYMLLGVSACYGRRLHSAAHRSRNRVVTHVLTRGARAVVSVCTARL